MISEAFFLALGRELPELSWQRDVPMSRYTTLRIGGPADCLAEPADAETLVRLRALADRYAVPVTLIGNGSNLLVLDGGIRGLVIRLGRRFSAASTQGQCVKAQSGALLSDLSQTALEAGLTGLEFAAGIPGTLGGAVTMNAGAYGGEMAQVLTTATLFDGQALHTLEVRELALGYRHSRVQETGEWVIEAELRLEPDDPQRIRERMQDLQLRRREKQPLNLPSAGSFFKRPAGGYAAQLIEQAGMKGRRHHGAMISDKHAGFLVNAGGASAADVLALAEEVSEAVFRMSGIRLEPEVRILGEAAL